MKFLRHASSDIHARKKYYFTFKNWYGMQARS